MGSMFVVTEECLKSVYTQSGYNMKNNDIIYCEIFESGDYHQVFIIAFLMFIIYFGMCLLPFAKYALFANAISNDRASLLTSNGRQEFIQQISDEQERNLALNRYNGIPFTLYLTFHALLSIIYLIIKIILIFKNEPDNRYKNINSRFKQGFKSFVNAETIILLYLITHNISNVKTLTEICKSRSYLSSELQKCWMWCCICLIWIDAIISIILLCYKWSLIIFFLYELAVAIIFILLFIMSCCCIIPIMIFMIVMIVNVFSLFGTNDCFGRFMMGLGSGLIIAGLGYFALSAMLCLIFVMVGGPSYAIIYLNLNDPNHKIVAILFIIAGIIGCMSVIAGMIYGCKDKNNPERQPMKMTGFEYV